MPVRSLHVTILLLIMLDALSGAEAEVLVWTVQERSVSNVIRLPGRTFARRQELISNPVDWLPIGEVVPDGAMVAAGQVVVRFDPMDLNDKLHEQELKREIQIRGRDKRLAEIDNHLLKLRERIDDQEGRLEVLQARRRSLLALPLRSDVRLAEGRLRLAQMDAEQAREDAEQADSRYQRGLIGSGERARLQAASEMAEARQEYAQRMLELAKRPTKPLELELIELEIANVELALADAQGEWEKQQGIAELQRAGARRRTTKIDREIAEIREDLDHLVITAPSDGFVLYTQAFEEALDELTGKMPRNVEFLRIPDAASLAVETELPEHMRQWFSVGDPVTLYLPGIAGRMRLGEVASLAEIPRDIEDTGKGRWGERDVCSGVKVYDVEIDCPGMTEVLRPGQEVRLEIRGSRESHGSCLPLEAVVHKDDHYHVAIDGRYQVVAGTPVGAWFLLEPGQLRVGQAVDRFGVFEHGGDGGPQLNESGDQLSVTGELTPFANIPITVGKIHWRGGKLTELADENSTVAEGDVLAQVNDAELEEYIDEIEDKVEDARNDAEKVHEELALLEDQSATRLERERNDLRIAEIRHELVQQQQNEPALFAARRDRQVAQVQLREAQRNWQNLQQRDPELRSETEQRAAERDVQRAELHLEHAQLRVADLEQGADAINRARTERDLLRSQLGLATSQKQVAFDLASKRNQLAWRERRQNGWQTWLDTLVSWRENLVIRAPSAGVVQYNIIWSRNGLRKIETGMTVYPRFRIMTIADISRMSVQVAVPEAYFAVIEIGMPVRCAVAERSGLSGSVESIDFMFEEKRRNDTDLGLYSEREPGGETVFEVTVLLDQIEDLSLQPGSIVTVTFPVEPVGPAL